MNAPEDGEINVRLRRSLWERIKAVAKENDVSGVKMVDEILEDRVYQGPEEGLARILQEAQEFCSRNSRALKRAFEPFDQEEGAIQHLKGQIEETLDVITRIGRDDYD